MEAHTITHSFFLIFTGAAVLATVALFTRQPLIIAYMVLGMAFGPYGMQLTTDLALLNDIAHTGIIFLLFLLGLDMQPKALLAVMKQAAIVAIASSLIFAGAGYTISIAFGFSTMEAIIIGLAMMFSSTIIGIKLLPTTVLHHRHTGELMIGLLLLQDVIAIFVLIWLMGAQTDSAMNPWLYTLLALPALVGIAFAMVRWVLLPLIARFDRFHEYIFLLALGWCLGMAVLAETLGLSGEMGAFIAGVALATSPIAQYLATSLKPLRDFFLVMFFFALGAQFNLAILPEIWLPAIVLAWAMLALKPVVFRVLLGRLSESPRLAWDVGSRLGQISEFSLLIVFSAYSRGMISEQASNLVLAAALITFAVSTYIVIMNYPNPIAIRDELRRD
ncbi:MAG TPA: cation:proton antiporter [Pseudomonadales bacterium]